MIRALQPFAILILSCTISAQPELFLETKEGYLRIDGFENREPFTTENGKKTFLTKRSAFSIESKIDELVQYGLICPIYEQYRIQENTRNFQSKETRFRTDVKIGQKNKFVPTRVDVVEIANFWGLTDENEFFMVLTFYDEDKTKFTAELLYISKGDLVDEGIVSDFFSSTHVTKRRLIPMILVMNPEGEFIKPSKNHSTEKHQTLMSSLLSDDPNLLERSITLHPELTSHSIMGYNLMHLAASWGAGKTLNVLHQRGFNPNSPSENKLYPIQMATLTERVSICQTLIELASKVRYTFSDDTTSLMHAAARGNLSLVKTLIEGGARPNAEDYNKQTAVYHAANSDHFDVWLYLLKNKGRFHFNDRNRSTMLVKALKADNLELLDFLIQKRTSVKKEKFGAYPLEIAARFSSGRLIEKLIEAGADPNIIDSKGNTLVALASRKNYDGLRTLVELGLDVNQANHAGASPLHIAIINHNVEATHLLLENGANPNVKNPNGTPLMWLATIVGNRIGLNDLIDAGATCQMTPQNAIPIMEYAFRNDIPEIVEITLNQCLDPSFKFHGDISAYWVADYYGSEELKNLLKSRGLETETVQAPEFVSSKKVASQIKLLEKSGVIYPEELQEKYGDFETTVSFFIETDGKVILPKVLKNPAKEIQNNLLNGLTKWKFEPIQYNGNPTRVKVITNVEYRAQEEHIFKIDSVQKVPQPIKQVAPNYSSSLLRSVSSGKIVMEFVVNKEGKVESVRYITTTHEDMIKPSLKALKEWEFTPGYRDGEPVKVRVQMPFGFRR